MKRSGWIISAIILGSIGLTILIISIFWIVFDKQYFSFFSGLNSKTASELGGYISGFVGIFWIGAGAILIYATFKEQQKHADKQQFESSFFNLINTYHDITVQTKGKIKNLSLNTNDEYTGRNFFSAVLNEIKNGLESGSFLRSICTREDVPEIQEFLKDIEKKQKGSSIEIAPEGQINDYAIDFSIGDLSKEFTVAQYEFFYMQHQSKLGHYFRFIYNIFKFTIEERNPYGDIGRYINLIQAQMSNDELGLLFYNALSKYGTSITGEKRFYNWLNDFDFFENIDPDSLIDRTHHKYYKTIFKFLTVEEKQEKRKYQKVL
jgi:hypothetical protein